MAVTRYKKIALIGGGAGALDSVDGANLLDSDEAHVYLNDEVYHYLLDATSGETESSPDVIEPDANSGDKRWILQTPLRRSALTNLITNSTLMGASKSTLEDVGSAVFSEDGEDADDSGNWAKADCTMVRTNDAGNGQGGSDFYYTITETNVTQLVRRTLTGLLTTGKLYRASIYIEDGTGTWESSELQAYNDAGDVILSFQIMNTEAGWTEYTVTWVAEGTDNQIWLRLSLGGGETAKWDSFTVYEVVPAFIGSDPDCFDGWTKNGGGTRPLIYRQQGGGNTKNGSFYSIRFVSTETSANSHWISPFNINRLSLEEHYKLYAGRTVTMAAFVKADTVGVAKLSFHDIGVTSSDPNTTTDWEWIELTRTIPDGTGTFNATFSVTTTGKDVYWSHFMLVYGDSIGEGNFQPRLGEIISHDVQYLLENYDTEIFGNIIDSGIDLESASNGKIGKGIRAGYLTLQVRDSAVASNVGAWLGPNTTESALLQGDVGVPLEGGGNDDWMESSGRVRCDISGGSNIWSYFRGSGTGTLDTRILMNSIQVR